MPERSAADVEIASSGRPRCVFCTDGMVRVVVKPTWAELMDVETTLPTAVEELVRERAARMWGRAAGSRPVRELRGNSEVG